MRDGSGCVLRVFGPVSSALDADEKSYEVGVEGGIPQSVLLLTPVVNLILFNLI